MKFSYGIFNSMTKVQVQQRICCLCLCFGRCSCLWLQRRIILVMSDMVTVNTSIFNLHVVKHNMFVCCLAWGGQTNVGDIVWSDNTATNEAFIMAPSRL